MPFFEGASHFVIKAAEMNDVTGDYNRTETHTSYHNRDVGNHYTSSVVNRGRTEGQNVALGGGSNTILNVHGRRQFNGNAQLDLSQLQMLQSLPQMLAEVPGAQATQISTVTGNAVSHVTGSTVTGSAGPRSVNVAATPAPAAQAAPPPSDLLNMLRNLPASAWTPQMRAALDTVLQASNAGSVSTEESEVTTDQIDQN